MSVTIPEMFKRRIIMFSFFERDIKKLQKINIDVKHAIIILVIYITISIIAFLIYPLIEKINYFDQLKEGFLFIVFFWSNI